MGKCTGPTGIPASSGHRGSNTVTASAGSCSGYTLVELILTLGVLAVMLLITTPVLQSLRSLKKASRMYYQDEIGLYQLQIELALHDISEVGDDCIEYDKEGEMFSISLVNGKLLSQPGSVDFIHDIDEVYFETVDNVIWMTYCRQERENRFPIGFHYEK